MNSFRLLMLIALSLCTFAIAPAVVEAQTGSISGVVTDNADEALPGAKVIAISGTGGWGGWGNMDISAVDGSYQIADLEPGTYELKARRMGFESVTVTVEVLDGVDTVADFTLSPPTYGTVSGLVTDSATGDPVEGAHVKILGGFGGGWGSGQTTTDAAGAYTLEDVRTGDRKVLFFNDGYFSQTADITIEDSVTTTQDAVLVALAYGSVSGVVTDAATGDPIEGAFVFIRGNGGFWGGWDLVTTDAAGAYAFADVLIGEQEVKVFQQGYFSETVAVTVTEGADTVADVVLGGLTYGAVSGIVTDVATGKGIEGAWVRVQWGGWTQTDSSGMYEVADVPTGTRNVRVFAWGYNGANSSVEVLEGKTANADFALELK